MEFHSASVFVFSLHQIPKNLREDIFNFLKDNCSIARSVLLFSLKSVCMKAAHYKPCF